MKTQFLGILLGLFGLLFISETFVERDAQALPAFARKHGVACSMCHTA